MGEGIEKTALGYGYGGANGAAPVKYFRVAVRLAETLRKWRSNGKAGEDITDLLLESIMPLFRIQRPPDGRWVEIVPSGAELQRSLNIVLRLIQYEHYLWLRIGDEVTVVMATPVEDKPKTQPPAWKPVKAFVTADEEGEFEVEFTEVERMW